MKEQEGHACCSPMQRVVIYVSLMMTSIGSKSRQNWKRWVLSYSTPWEEESVTQTGTTIAGIKWASVNILSECINSYPLLVINRLPSCTPLTGYINAIIFPSLLPFFETSISPVCSNAFSIAT